MGKSNKKARSDRINALRKQYDAFLEEDKKRKERNDFILGRLDKMRYNSALVPIRHKFQPSTFDTRPVVVDHLGHQLQVSPAREFQPPTINQNRLIPNIPVKNIEETYLIQEISKRYILIPKVRSTFTNNYIRNEIPQQNTEDLQVRSDQEAIPIKDFNSISGENTDWKSKYEILNILKKEENEKQNDYINSVEAVSGHSVHPERVLGNKNEHNITTHYDNHLNTGLNDDTAINGVDQFPVKDLSSDPINYKFSKDSENNQNTNIDANLISNTSREYNEVLEPSHGQAVADGYDLQNISYDPSDARNIDAPETLTIYEPQSASDANVISVNADVPSDQPFDIVRENIDVKDEIPVAFDSLKIHEQNEPADQDNSEKAFYEDEVRSSQILNSETPVKETNYNPPPVIGVADSILENESGTDISHDQGFEPSNEIQMKTDVNVVPEDQTTLDTNIGSLEHAEPVIKQTEPVIEQTENQVNISESIEDFDAEQREMFYSEQADENYANQQGDVATPYDLQYTQNEYPQNQEYAYYDNTEAAAYSAELTDEAVTQQYDPNYEQQYTDVDQGVEQQQYVQQYEEPARDTNQVDPEYQTMQYEQEYESHGNIEETLDTEEGYVMQPHDTQSVEQQPNVEVPAIEGTEAENIPVSE